MRHLFARFLGALAGSVERLGGPQCWCDRLGLRGGSAGGCPDVGAPDRGGLAPNELSAMSRKRIIVFFFIAIPSVRFRFDIPFVDFQNYLEKNLPTERAITCTLCFGWTAISSFFPKNGGRSRPS
jgi:hypothetical protein